MRPLRDASWILVLGALLPQPACDTAEGADLYESVADLRGAPIDSAPILPDPDPPAPAQGELDGSSEAGEGQDEPVVEDAPPVDPDEPIRIWWDDLTSFEYEMLEPDDLLDIEDGAEVPDLEDRFPIEIIELDGKKVTLDGYMIPYEYDDRGIYSFTLVRDQAQCCFGASPMMNHWITTVMADDGRAEPADLDPISVTGTFEVGELVEDGYVVNVYRLKADDVEFAW